MNHRRWWQNSALVDNCSDAGPKRQRAETGHFAAESGVSAKWRRNQTMCDSDQAGGEAPDITVSKTKDVSDNQQQVSHALHVTNISPVSQMSHLTGVTCTAPDQYSTSWTTCRRGAPLS